MRTEVGSGQVSTRGAVWSVRVKKRQSAEPRFALVSAGTKTFRPLAADELGRRVGGRYDFLGDAEISGDKFHNLWRLLSRRTVIKHSRSPIRCDEQHCWPPHLVAASMNAAAGCLNRLSCCATPHANPLVSVLPFLPQFSLVLFPTPPAPRRPAPP